jgi:hypothetical protein
MGGHASGEVAPKMAIDTMKVLLRHLGGFDDLALQDGPVQGYEENRLITG